jgi:hypothetical protein
MVSQRLLNEIRATAETYFRAGGADSSRLLEDTVREAIRVSNEEYGVAAAVQWAAGYRFPEEMVKSDERCLQAAQMDFVAMVRRRLITLEPTRLNRERADGLSVDNERSWPRKECSSLSPRASSRTARAPRSPSGSHT